VIDVNTLIGPYPFREVPHPDPDALVRVLDREGIEGAWVGHLPSAFHRDPTAGNAALFDALRPFRGRLRPVPAIRPDWPNWTGALGAARDQGAPAVRAYPPQWGLAPGGGASRHRLSLPSVAEAYSAQGSGSTLQGRAPALLRRTPPIPRKTKLGIAAAPRRHDRGRLVIVGGEGTGGSAAFNGSCGATLLSPFVRQQLGTFVVKEHARYLLQLRLLERFEANPFGPLADLSLGVWLR